MTFLFWVFAIWIVSLGITLTVVKDSAIRDWKKGEWLNVIYATLATSVCWPFLLIRELLKGDKK